MRRAPARLFGAPGGCSRLAPGVVRTLDEVVGFGEEGGTRKRRREREVGERIAEVTD